MEYNSSRSKGQQESMSFRKSSYISSNKKKSQNKRSLSANATITPNHHEVVKVPESYLDKNSFANNKSSAHFDLLDPNSYG